MSRFDRPTAARLATRRSPAVSESGPGNMSGAGAIAERIQGTGERRRRSAVAHRPRLGRRRGRSGPRHRRGGRRGPQGSPRSQSAPGKHQARRASPRGCRTASASRAARPRRPRSNRAASRRATPISSGAAPALRGAASCAAAISRASSDARRGRCSRHGGMHSARGARRGGARRRRALLLPRAPWPRRTHSGWIVGREHEGRASRASRTRSTGTVGFPDGAGERREDGLGRRDVRAFEGRQHRLNASGRHRSRRFGGSARGEGGGASKPAVALGSTRVRRRPYARRAG